MNAPNHASPHALPEAGAAPRQEASDVSARGILVFLSALVAALAVILALVWWGYEAAAARAKRSDAVPSPLASRRLPPPEPRLQPDPPGDLAALQRRQRRELAQLRWRDRSANVVQIPIERAMQWVVEHGVPDWPDTDAGQPSPAAGTTSAPAAPLDQPGPPEPSR